MHVLLHSSLQQEDDPKIRWPGATALPSTFDYARLAAMCLKFSAKTSDAEIERYSTSSRGMHGESTFNATNHDPNIYPGSERFLMSRLVLREWVHALHGDCMSVFFGDEPKVTSRIRTYKGLVSKECRATAKSYDQVEIETGRGTSTLLNRTIVNSAASPSCLFGLADTFRAFGILGDGNSPEAHPLLADVASCYGEVRGIWRWSAEKLLPVVCTGLSSLVFMQGAANETNLEMVVYMPSGEFQRHLEILKTKFAVEVSES